jgi:osmotically inducible protein OsmC
MATQRKAEVEWIGDLMEGEGKLLSTTSGLIPELEVTWAGRNDEEEGQTSPEELLAAAHASCFSMQLAHGLVGAGWTPEVIEVSATVEYENGIGITGVNLVARAEAEGVPDDVLRQVAERAKAICPISKALAGVEITLELPDLPPPEDEDAVAEEFASVGDDADEE